jgi:hypothetical protein
MPNLLVQHLERCQRLLLFEGLSLLEGNMIDLLSLAAGALCMFIRPLKRFFLQSPTKPLFNRRDCIFDFLNGTTLIAFGLLVATAFSNRFLHLALQSKLSIAIAGAVGLIFVFGEFFADLTE